MNSARNEKLQIFAFGFIAGAVMMQVLYYASPFREWLRRATETEAVFFATLIGIAGSAFIATQILKREFQIRKREAAMIRESMAIAYGVSLGNVAALSLACSKFLMSEMDKVSSEHPIKLQIFAQMIKSYQLAVSPPRDLFEFNSDLTSRIIRITGVLATATNNLEYLVTARMPSHLESCAQALRKIPELTPEILVDLQRQTKATTPRSLEEWQKKIEAIADEYELVRH